MSRIDKNLSEEIKQNRSNINARLEEMRQSVIPSFWYSFFKSSWLISLVVALILLFVSSDGQGLFSGGEMSPVRIVAIALIAYGVLADLVFAPLVERSFLKRHPQYKQRSSKAKRRAGRC